jgi:hypothetical protein
MYTYHLKFSKAKDLWDWLDVAKIPICHGVNWLDNGFSPADQKIFLIS